MAKMTRLFDLLRAKGLLWESILPCSQIGVHPMNRNGAGTSASHVEELLTTLVELGFCMSQTKCVCIEVPTHDATVSTLNESMARESQRTAGASCSGQHPVCQCEWQSHMSGA